MRTNGNHRRTMELINYTNKWLEGEIFEGYAIMIAGIAMLILTFFVWRFGTSDAARAIWIPMLIVGLLHIGTGVGMVITNNHRIEQFSQEYKQQTPAEFAQKEKARVDGFMGIYPQTIIWAAVLLVIGICLFSFCSAHWIRGTALVLIYLALSLLVIDYFSKARAITYQKHINDFLIEAVE